MSRVLTTGAAVLALAAPALVLTFSTPGAGAATGTPGSHSARAAAVARLGADATGPLRLTRDARGVVRFVGTDAGNAVRNPAVSATSTRRAAARSHLERYAAALGVRAGDLRATEVRRTDAGGSVVRYQQRVGGIRVIGGQVVVGLRPDRQLSSVQSTAIPAHSVRPAVVGRAQAARVARQVARRAGVDGATVTSQGRWWWSPRTLQPGVTQADRTVWRFAVTGRPGQGRTVLVDDRTGGVLLDIASDQSALNRVVCDQDNAVMQAAPCVSGFARTEGGAASGVTDVNEAYDHAGEVWNFYHQVAGIDLTQLLGVTLGGGGKALASTVRFCDSAQYCPLENAFWNGTQMYYGDGFANADDVVGHEMTHGVINRNSDLFYWGESGAINESLADTMGEIVDHRSTLQPVDAQWQMGEDLSIGAIRSMKDPTLFGQPDRTTSSSYTGGLGDSGGVHTNSGVGNKTAYLISQGGTFNGQTITGIDGSDTSLTKTAKLYYDVILSLASGSDYASLADVLDQSCQDLLSAGTAGFTAADCDNVHKATLATTLRTAPTVLGRPADAASTCPAGSTKRVLFDSETLADPSSGFTKGSTWRRDGIPGWGANATSGHDSWASSDPATLTTSSLTKATAVTVPAGQKTYLWFQHWYVLDYDPDGYYDGGTMEVSSDGGSFAAPAAASWVNGPTRTLFGTTTKAWSGDSLGWVASRLDLSSYGGHAVTPRFTLRTDKTVSYIGWYVDDVRVYTCDVKPSAPTSIKGVGKVGSAVVSWGAPTTNPGVVTGYQIWLDGTKLKTFGPGTRSVSITGLKQGHTYAVSVIPTAPGGDGPAAAVSLKGTTTSLAVTRTTKGTRLAGKVLAGLDPVAGRSVLVQYKTSTGWKALDTVPTDSKGHYQLDLTSTSTRTYRTTFAGAKGLMGSRSATDHL